MYVPKAVGDFILARAVAGAKAVRYLLSSKYRTTLRNYWGSHPGTRGHHIRMMVCGVILDGTVVLVVVGILSGH